MSDENQAPSWATEEVPIDYFEGRGDEDVSESTLERLVKLANDHAVASQEVQDLVVKLAEAEERLKGIARVSIPNLMDELGMAQFKMADGSIVSVEDKVSASITIANRPAAYHWLVENDYDGIIKTKVVASFGKGENDDAQKAYDALFESGFAPVKDESIHHQTLQSFVKERLAAGEALPDSFGVHEFKEAKIKLPKKKK